LTCARAETARLAAVRRCGGATEIVGSNPRELRIGSREVGTRPDEASPPELGIPKHAPHWGCEQEVAPVFASHMPLEHRVEKFRLRNGSTRVGLGRAPNDRAVGLGNRLDDVYAAPGGIYPLNLQGSKLPPSDSCVHE